MVKGLRTMQIVINTDKKFIDLAKKGLIMGGDIPTLANAIANGIVLPKGHGDLVTKEQMIDLVEFYQMNPQHFDFVNLIDEIRDEKPIIEADRSEEC